MKRYMMIQQLPLIKQYCLLTIACCIMMVSTNAQGVFFVDETGREIPFVSIWNKNNRQHSMTDAFGYAKLKGKAGDTLIIRHLGHELAQFVWPNGSLPAEINLQSQVFELTAAHVTARRDYMRLDHTTCSCLQDVQSTPASVFPKEKETSNFLQVYPNPFTSGVTIKASSQNGRLRLYSAGGQLILDQHMNQFQFYPLDMLPAATYFVEFLDESTNEVHRKKIVKASL